MLKRKRKHSRRVKPPTHLKWAIVEALKRKPDATYKELQELAFKIYKERREASLPLYGALGDVNPELLEKVLEDEGLSYED